MAAAEAPTLPLPPLDLDPAALVREIDAVGEAETPAGKCRGRYWWGICMYELSDRELPGGRSKSFGRYRN